MKCEGEPQVFTATSDNLLDLLYQWQVSTDNGSTWNNLVNDTNFAGVNQPTLTVIPPFSFNGHLVRCRMGNNILPPDYSSPQTITVQARTSILLQPQPVQVRARDMALFSVTAQGSNMTYQWQVNSGDGWAPLTDDGVYLGAATATLTVASTPWFMHQYAYRCVVSGACGPPAVSDAAPILISNLSNYVTQPVPATVCEGKEIPFTVYVYDGAEYTYQWQESRDGGIQWSNLSDGSPYGQVTTFSLNVVAGLAVNGFYYRCRLSRGSDLFTSEAVKLDVLARPVIAVHPAPMVTCPGSTAAFNVGTTGVNISYQWQVNTGDGSWTNITDDEVYSGAYTQNLALTSVTATLDGYQYRCRVSGDCPPDIYSGEATLTVLGPNTWKGITTDWQDAQNWCGGVPDTNTNITIKPGVAHMPLAAAAYCRDLTIESGAFITMTGAFTIQGTPTLLGELQVGAQTLILNGGPIQGNPANLVTQPTSNLVLGGVATGVFIPAGIRTLNKVVLNNSSSSGVSLAGNLSLAALEFQQGRLMLHTSNLRMLGPGAISGADSTRYVVTNDDPETGGFLIQPVRNNETYVAFPVGTVKSYSPAKIKLALLSAADTFRVRVFDKVFTGGTTGAQVTSNAVNKTWLIEEAVVGGSEATVSLGWLKKDELSGFNKDKAVKAHYKQDKWEFTEGLLGFKLDLLNINWAPQGIFTDFSPFTVVDQEAATSLLNVAVKVKAFLQGPYNATTGLMNTSLNSLGYLPLTHPYTAAPWNYGGTESVASDFFAANPTIVDWVLLEFRTGTAASTAVAKKACFLKSNGEIVGLDGTSNPIISEIPAGNFYIVVRHRNHLAAMSASTIALSTSSVEYDFTTDLNKFYGGDASFNSVSSKYLMIVGDASTDDRVTYTFSNNDRTKIINTLNGNTRGLLKGYFQEDLNLDGRVTYTFSNNDRTTLINVLQGNARGSKISKVPK